MTDIFYLNLQEHIQTLKNRHILCDHAKTDTLYLNIKKKQM